MSGIVVHDHWKPYYTMPGVEHALCNVHQLRELKAFVEIEKEDWARWMQTLLRWTANAASMSRDRDTGLAPRLIVFFSRSYDTILAISLVHHNVHLIMRLMERNVEILRFLVDPTLPFINNQAERDIRIMKLRQKISVGIRSDQGAENFATIRSLIPTATKQGWNVIEALTANPQALIGRLRLT